MPTTITGTSPRAVVRPAAPASGRELVKLERTAEILDEHLHSLGRTSRFPRGKDGAYIVDTYSMLQRDGTLLIEVDVERGHFSDLTEAKAKAIAKTLLAPLVAEAQQQMRDEVSRKPRVVYSFTVR